MRRYMGNTWVSVREAAALLNVPEESVVSMIGSNLVSCVWLLDPARGQGIARSRRLFLAQVQVDQLALRFAALDAAFSDWDKKVTEVFVGGGLKEV